MANSLFSIALLALEKCSVKSFAAFEWILNLI